MRQWGRVNRDRLCGRCGETIYRDQPALFINIEKVKREIVRCADCDGPAPPGLPYADRQRATKPMQHITRTIPRDVSAILSGWRVRYGESK